MNELIDDENVKDKVGKSINPDVEELTNKKLRRLEIEFVTISKANCDDFELELKTSWTNYPIGQMYLTKTGCNDTKATKGNYWTDNNFIEVWGLGDDWIIWADRPGTTSKKVIYFGVPPRLTAKRYTHLIEKPVT